MIEIKNISKIYRKGTQNFVALDQVSLNIGKGDFLTVTGASGSGKSTLLNTLGGLVKPDSGSVHYGDKNIYEMTPTEAASYRRTKVGFVFQQFHLLPYLSVKENISMACVTKEDRAEIDNWMKKCRIGHLALKNPSELSVGEKQRVAFIRAIISGPELLLADEPTGNLDPENSLILMEMIGEFHINGGTVVLVSHDPGVSQSATRKINLVNGKINS